MDGSISHWARPLEFRFILVQYSCNIIEQYFNKFMMILDITADQCLKVISIDNLNVKTKFIYAHCKN